MSHVWTLPWGRFSIPRRRLAAILLAALLGGPWLALPPAQAEPYEVPDHRVDDALTDAVNEVDPSVDSDGAGGVYVAYVTATAGDPGDIWFARSLDGGATFPFRTRIDDDPGSLRQANPDIAVDAAGTLYAAWESYSAAGDDAEIRFSRSLDGGATWGDGIRNNNDRALNDDFSGFQLEPDLETFGAGTVYAAWSDERRVHPDIFFTASADSGTTWGTGLPLPNVRVTDDPGNAPQQQPAMAVNETGSIFVANRDRRQGDEDIFVAHSLDGGATWSQNVRVNDDRGRNAQGQPAIAAYWSTVYVLWVDQRAGVDQVFSSRSYDGGTTWGDAIDNNDNDIRVDDGTGPVLDPAVAVRLGTIHAVWRDSRRGTPDIFSSESTDGGQTWGDGLPNDNDPRVNDDPAWSVADQILPDLAVTGTATCAVFQDNRDANHDVRLTCRGNGAWGNGRIDSRDVVVAGWGTPNPLDRGRPDVATHAGAIHAVWEDRRDGSLGVYHSVSTDGGQTWGNGLLDGDDHRVDDARLGNQDHASLAISLTGTVGVAWRDSRFLIDTDIRFSASLDDGLTWGNGEIDNGDVRVNDDPGVAAQDWPSLGVLPNGTFVMAWEDRRSGNPDIFFAYSLDNGATWSRNVRVDDDPASGWQLRPSVHASSDGTVHIAYADNRLGDYDIRFTACVLSRFGAVCGDGVTGNDAVVSDDLSGSDQLAPVVTAALGRIAVAWEDRRTGDWDVRASTSLDGMAWGDGLPGNDPVVPGNVSGDQRGASLAGDATALYAGWTDSGAGDVWSALSRDATAWADESKPNVPASGAAAQANARVDLTATHLLAMWEDGRSGMPEIWFARAPRASAPPPATLALIVLNPSGPVPLVPNQTMAFTALGYDSDFSQNLTWTPTWATTDPGRGSLNVTGGDANSGYTALYAALLEGQDNVTAANGTVLGAAAISTVARPLPLDRIELDPASASVLPLGTVPFTARGYDAAGFLNTSWGPEWVAPALGTLGGYSGNASAGHVAVYTAGCPMGADPVTVSNGTVSATVDLTIVPGPIAEIRLSPWPGPVPVVVNALASFRALGYDACGNLNTSWSQPLWSTGPLGVLVTSGGNPITGYLATFRAGTQLGSTWIRALTASVQNSTFIEIVPGAVARIELTPWPGPVAIGEGTTQNFLALAYDVQGNRNTSWTPTWTTGPLGRVIVSGGTGATGYFAIYRADTVAGDDFIEVAGGGRTNRTTLRIVGGPIERLELTPWPGPTVLSTGSEQVYTARAYDGYGNLNVSWSPSWGTTDGRGILLDYAGNPTSGFTIRYQAGPATGDDNITVSAGGLTNSSAIRSVPLWSDPLVRIELTPWPATQTVPLFTAIPFTALGYDLSGAQNLTWVPTWETGPFGAIAGTGGDATLGYTATFDAGAAAGATWMRVHAAGVEKVTPVTVKPAPLVRLEITPPPVARVHLLNSLLLTARGYDEYGNLNLSWYPTWNISGGHGVLGNFAGNALVGYTAIFRAGTTIGFDTVSVAYEAIRNATVIDVLPGPLTRIAIGPWPGPILLNPGSRQTYTARGYDAYGHVNETWVATWGSSTGRGSVVPTGGTPSSGFTAEFVAGPAEGLENITVGAEGLSNQSAVYILLTAALALVELVPHPVAVVNLGETLAFHARAFDDLGRLNSTWQAYWSLSTTAFGDLSSVSSPFTGLFQAVFNATALGEATLTVSSGAGVSNTTTVRVVDLSAPATRVMPLAGLTNDDAVTLEVNVTEAGGSGLDHLEIWVRQGTGPWAKFGDFPEGPVPHPFGLDGRYEFYSVGVDVAGNREAPPASADAWTVRDTQAPTLVRRIPEGTVDPRGFHVEVTFSEPVQRGSVQLLVHAGGRTWTAMGEGLAWQGNTLVWSPDTELPPGAAVTIRVMNATDPAGNVMAPDEWQAATAGAGLLPGTVAAWSALSLLVVATLLILLLLAKRRRRRDEEPLPVDAPAPTPVDPGEDPPAEFPPPPNWEPPPPDEGNLK